MRGRRESGSEQAAAGQRKANFVGPVLAFFFFLVFFFIYFYCVLRLKCALQIFMLPANCLKRERNMFICRTHTRTHTPAHTHANFQLICFAFLLFSRCILFATRIKVCCSRIIHATKELALCHAPCNTHPPLSHPATHNLQQCCKIFQRFRNLFVLTTQF